MPIAQLPSGLTIAHREWKFKDMRRWAKVAQDGGKNDDLLVEASVSTLESVIDPGPYAFLGKRTTVIDASRLLKKDVLWWVYRVRAASFPEDPKHGLTGEDYVFDWTCHVDKKHVVAPKAIKLCDLRVKPLPEASVEHVRTGKDFTHKMPGGEVVSFVLPTVGIDKPLDQLTKRRTTELRRTQKGAKAVEPTMAEIVACQVTRVSSLGENQSLERRAEYIDDLSIREWASLKNAITAAAPEIYQTVDCICDECGAKTEVRLPLTPGFFFPTEEEEAPMPDLETQEDATAKQETPSSSTSPP
jgi:hypothetical protein